MRIVFSIEVGVDVPSFVQAGEILDKVSRNFDEIIGTKGEYDIRNFQTHHMAVRKYPSEVQAVKANIPDADEYRG